MRLITASSFARAQACAASQVLPRVYEPPSTAADVGTAVHRYVQRLAEVGREAALAEVPDEWRARCARIDTTALPHASGGYAVEVALAWAPDTGEGRELARNVEGRGVYQGLDGGAYVAGTADLVGVTADAVVVLDVKTGHGYLPEPSRSAQLRGLAVMAAAAYGRTSAVVGYVLLRDDTPRVWTEALDGLELASERETLREMRHRVARLWGRWARPSVANPLVPDVAIGDHCRYCPALRACPAYTSLMAVAETPAQVDALERQAKLARAQLDARAAQTPVPLPDGRVYGARLRQRRRVDSARALAVLRERHPGLDVAALADVSAAGLKRLGLDESAEMAALEAAGAVEWVASEVVEAHKP